LNIKSTLLGLALISVPATFAFAHHSFSDFDMSKMVEISGIVAEVQYRNPHVWVFVDVDNQGQPQSWAVEAGGPNILMRQGGKANTLKAGDKVDIQLAPMKDETKRGGALQAMRFPDGKIIGVWK